MFKKRNDINFKRLCILFAFATIFGLFFVFGFKFDNVSNSREVLSNGNENSATGKVTLTWDEVPNAEWYNLYYSEYSEVPKNDRIKIPAVAKPPETVPNLTRGKKYYFVVTAVNGGGESGYSNIVSYYVR